MRSIIERDFASKGAGRFASSAEKSEFETESIDMRIVERV